MKFANLADAGDRMAPLLADLPTDSLLIAIMPSGIAVACRIAKRTRMDVGAAFLEHTDDGVRVSELPPVDGRTAVIVDDGIETGTAVRAVVEAVRAAGAARVIVAMPVVPREVEAWLGPMVDQVIAIERPLVRRSLAWHYEEFDPIDDDMGRFILARQAWKRGWTTKCVPEAGDPELEVVGEI
ncbi:MAG: phosphoribosyltransferase family protein [Candidatus Nanopelagicales bacterium]